MIGEGDLWFKNGIFYALDVKAFQDSNSDGIGDFPGLTSRLDYLAGLGATCLWLLPFYPSPWKDNGYDVADYYSVDPRLGTLGDFVEFSQQASQRGIRVMIDLVVNHTSDQHAWFQEARQDCDSRYRDYYVWAQDVPEKATGGTAFPGVESTTWTYDDRADAYYMHRFYSHQPDLNTMNPAVQQEIKKIMGFWLQLGVTGFRLDAAPFIAEMKGIGRARHEYEILDDPELKKNPFYILQRMREFLSWRQGDAIFLAEANVPYEEVQQYVGQGNRMHLVFDFLGNQHLFLALARRTAAPMRATLEAHPPMPRVTQWVNFLRNHDELDLGRLGAAEREDVYREMAPDETMRIYRRGIRRRLAPILGGDSQRIRLAYSLMFSLPGTPMLLYGEEIGMGEDLSLAERESVRTSMQWTDERNGGFSDAPKERLLKPVIDEGDYSFHQVNVAAQQRDPESLLSWLQRLINTRRDCLEVGWGDLEVLELGHDAVLACRYQWRNGTVIVLNNLSAEPCNVRLDLTPYERGHLVDLLGDGRYVPIEETAYVAELEGYGYRWFRVQRRDPGTMVLRS